MSILFSCSCNQPERLQMAIEPIRSILRISGVTRWGLSYVQAGEVLLTRTPRAVPGEFDFYSVLDSLQSDYCIGCAADDELYRGNSNTQPFRFKHWMFAMESDIEDFSPIQAQMEALMPGFLRRSIQGKTPAEYVFHVFLSLLYDKGQIDNRNLAAAQSGAALRDALILVDSMLADAKIPGRLGNLMVSNSRSLLAVRRYAPLFLRRLRQLEDPKRPETEFRSVMLIGAGLQSEQLEEGFEELPEESIVTIGRDLSTNIIYLRRRSI